MFSIDEREDIEFVERLAAASYHPSSRRRMVVTDLNEMERRGPVVDCEPAFLCNILLSLLTDVQREVIECIFFDDLTVAEVATRLGMSRDEVALLAASAFDIMRIGRKRSTSVH